MPIDRARVVAVIRDIREMAIAGRATPTEVAEARGEEIVRDACDKHGLSADDFCSGLDGDRDLASLFRHSMDEALVGSTDPGPYDTISRESARGTPDPEPEASERDARLLGDREFR